MIDKIMGALASYLADRQFKRTLKEIGFKLGENGYEAI